jgi:hypothetical protein
LRRFSEGALKAKRKKLRYFFIGLIGLLLFVAAKTHLHCEEVGNEADPVSTTLRADQHRHGQMFYSNIKAVVSIGGFFEFFNQNILSRQRKRIASGPWSGSLPGSFQQGPGNNYSLSGRDNKTGIDYTIHFEQKTRDTVEIAFSFTAPQEPAGLSFEILKLSGDVFKGSSINALPSSSGDVKEFPPLPRQMGKHVLLRGKNKVSLKGILCDVEISDLTNGHSIDVADFRNAPWDNEKSLYFGVNVDSLQPGKKSYYSYSVRFLKPSTSRVIGTDNAKGLVVQNQDTRPVFSIIPKQQSVRNAFYQISSGDVIFSKLSGKTVEILGDGIEKMTGMKLKPISGSIPPPGKGFYIEMLSEAGKSNSLTNSSSEYYEIDVNEKKVQISCKEERGCLYGAYTLLGIIQKDKDEWVVKSQTAKDWPDLPVRAIQLEVLKPAIRDVDLFKRYLDAFSMVRINTIIFFHDPRQILAWKKKADEGWWTKQQIAEIAAYARSLHMDVFGGMISKFDSKQFPLLDIAPGSDFYNPYNENAYKYLFSLYEEILGTYKPTGFLVGHDEIKGLSVYASKYKKSTAEVFAKGITTIHAWFAERNIPIILASDMLLDWNVWNATVGAANSQNPVYNSGATHLAIDLIPKDISIIDWHYDNKPDYQSIKYFRQKGFQVLACPWYDPSAARSLAQSAHKYGAKGIVGTDFGFWSTLSPAATTLYTPLFGWSERKTVDENDLDVVALSDNMRETYSTATLRQMPIDMSSSFNKTTWDKGTRNNKGIFGLGPFLDLRGLESGRKYYKDILFEVVDSKEGERNNCLVVQDTRPPRQGESTKGLIDFKNTKAALIAFLHTCMQEEPNYRPHTIGKYTVVYEDGSKAVTELKENWNITDIRSSVGLRFNSWTFGRAPDVLIGSQLVWKGTGVTGIPLNLQTFIWKNPHPEKPIKEIQTLVTEDAQSSKIAIIGITVLN